MELTACVSVFWALLIVPYGIETVFVGLCILLLRLLIVPYGIETWKDIGSKSVNLLLIVPYGIETNGIIYTFKKRKALLIVPYGIETPLSAFLL